MIMTMVIEYHGHLPPPLSVRHQGKVMTEMTTFVWRSTLELSKGCTWWQQQHWREQWKRFAGLWESASLSWLKAGLPWAIFTQCVLLCRFSCGFRKRQKIIKELNVPPLQIPRDPPPRLSRPEVSKKSTLKWKILSNFKIRSSTVRDGVKFVRPKNPLRTFRTLTFRKCLNTGVEHFFEWPCRWVSHQGLWSKTFYAGTAAFKVSIQKIYKGNTPAFYNYFIGLLLFFVFLAFASLHNLNISSKVSTAFKENLFRKWSSTPCLPPSLLWRPTTKWYKLYQTIPIYAKPWKTKHKANFASVALLPSRSGWTRSRRLKRHVVMWCSPLQILLSSHLYRSKTQSW